jgi:hypothetical protein
VLVTTSTKPASSSASSAAAPADTVSSTRDTENSTRAIPASNTTSISSGMPIRLRR